MSRAVDFDPVKFQERFPAFGPPMSSEAVGELERQDVLHRSYYGVCVHNMDRVVEAHAAELLKLDNPPVGLKERLMEEASQFIGYKLTPGLLEQVRAHLNSCIDRWGVGRDIFVEKIENDGSPSIVLVLASRRRGVI